MPPRLIGLYALATMERDGAVHGYLLSQRIAERTAGAWRPGPGAVYPSLRALVDHGLAARRGVGRRREYRITPSGRATLRRIRRRSRRTGQGGADLSSLWAEVLGVDDAGVLLVRRLERSLDGLAAYLAQHAGDRGGRSVRSRAEAVLRRGRAQLRGNRRRRGAARRAAA